MRTIETLKSNLLLESATLLYEKREKLLLQSPQSDQIQQAMKMVAEFFGVNFKMAALLSVLICEQLMGEVNPVKKVMRQMGFDSMDIIQSNPAIKEFKRLGWFQGGRRRNSVVRGEEIEITKKVIDAVLCNDKSRLEKDVPENLALALMQLRRFMSNMIEESEFDELSTLILMEARGFSNFSFISAILDDALLIDPEKIVLIWMGSDLVYGKEQVDLSPIIDKFAQDPAYTLWFKQRIVKGKSQLLTGKYIEFRRPNFIDFSEVIFGEKLQPYLHELRHDNQNKKHSVRYCTRIEPADQVPKDLFFNEDLNSNVSKIDKLLSEDYYRKLMSTFGEKGMSSCLTMLFHGLPGTGKTELVRQLARRHGRTTYQVDISGIKDMWVGESEKNLKRVFKEYEEAIKFSEVMPILLFNEADAIIGIRTDVQHSVDQMNNSLQNILLQELEDMKGIFIATTNLIKNIDGAFDRRLLFKQRFDLPDSFTRLKILQSEFPEMRLGFLENIAKNCELSGGQIQNMKRKLLADELLFGSAANCEATIADYIRGELEFRRPKAKVGFN